MATSPDPPARRLRKWETAAHPRLKGERMKWIDSSRVSLAMSGTALFVALGGTAVAVTQVGTSQIATARSPPPNTTPQSAGPAIAAGPDSGAGVDPGGGVGVGSP
jgi:hypothetical protein